MHSCRKHQRRYIKISGFWFSYVAGMVFIMKLRRRQANSDVYARRRNEFSVSRIAELLGVPMKTEVKAGSDISASKIN